LAFHAVRRLRVESGLRSSWAVDGGFGVVGGVAVQFSLVFVPPLGHLAPRLPQVHATTGQRRPLSLPVRVVGTWFRGRGRSWLLGGQEERRLQSGELRCQGGLASVERGQREAVGPACQGDEQVVHVPAEVQRPARSQDLEVGRCRCRDDAVLVTPRNEGGLDGAHVEVPWRTAQRRPGLREDDAWHLTPCSGGDVGTGERVELVVGDQARHHDRRIDHRSSRWVWMASIASALRTVLTALSVTIGSPSSPGVTVA